MNNGEPSVATVTTAWGDRLNVWRHDASHHGTFLETGVSWDFEDGILAAAVRPGMRVLDIGANYGYCTTMFASLVGAAGRVVAVEPDAALLDLLRANITGGGYQQVTVVERAMGDHVGAATLWQSSSNLARHSLTRSLVPNLAGNAEVALTTIDRLCDDLGLVPDLVKVDAEGAEAAIIRGARGTLATARPVVWVEFWPDGLIAAGESDAGGLLDLLVAAGYRVTAYDLMERRAVATDRTTALAYCQGMHERLAEIGQSHLGCILYVLAEPVEGIGASRC